MISRLLTIGMMILSLVMMFGEDTSDAQVRIDGVDTSLALPAGIKRDGDVLEVFTVTGGFRAPVIAGFLSPPQTEPVTPAQHRAVWLWCDGPREAVVCTWKVNYFGSILEVAGGEWNLQ